jgi:Holliday junction resolvasome RuvABC ATP-dependent DNA helicase subunit
MGAFKKHPARHFDIHAEVNSDQTSFNIYTEPSLTKILSNKIKILSVINHEFSVIVTSSKNPPRLSIKFTRRPAH